MYSSSASASGSFFMIVMFCILICYIVAWVFTMQIVTKAAEEKGYGELKGKLWFIGLFGLIVTPCVIVAALPDKMIQRSMSAEAKSKAIDSELPKL